ncbi:hypothetical protein DNTS_032257 [Danionella cerebrum]|uniref:RAP domain-containing protein n=1 Tax=Danionella cerebrum TaxID=2873325 RepID=A0A553RDB1_9TELE|nr:hypothetical protein DNTS_032257 [Danionella translucida]
MNMHKSGLGMLRCALRSTLLWKCDISIMKQVPLCYNIKSLASTQLGSDKNKALASKSIRYYSHSAPDAAKESTAATETTEVQQNEAEKNALLVYLAGCKSPTEVLDELNRYSISVNEIGKIFFRMWECIEEMNSEQKQMKFKLIIEHPEFSALCERLMIEAGAMKHHALGRTLYAAVNLGVSQDSRVVQTLLRVAQEHLNQFDLNSLCILSRVLHDMKSRNALALREAIWLLLKDHIYETSNVATLTKLMNVVGKDSPLKLKKQLASKVFSLLSEFTSVDNFYIFSSMANIDLNHTHLLDTCSKKLAENIHDYSIAQLLKVLRCCHKMKYRNYTLFSSISKHMALTIDMCTDQQVLKILQAFEKLIFRPVELLDVFAERIIQEPEYLSVNELLTVLRVFSMANHDLKDKKTEYEHLNQFDLNSLCILSRALHDMKSRNALALREAIWLLLKDHIYETSNVATLTKLMNVVGKDSPLKLKKQLASKVFSLSSEFTSVDNFYIFSSMANIDVKHTHLLDTCSKKLAENIHDYSFTQLLKVLRCCYQMKYRNYTLFSSISKHMALTIDMCTDQQVLKILQAFEKLIFRPVELLDVFAERIIQEPEYLSVNELLTVLRVFSMANHDLKDKKTEFLSSLMPVIELHLPKMSPGPLLSLTFYLSLMQHFPPKPLEILLQPRTVECLMQSSQDGPEKNSYMLYALNLSLRLENPPLPSSMSSLTKLNLPSLDINHRVDQEIRSLIREIVGRDAVQEAVVEQGFYFIDFVISLPVQEETPGLQTEGAGSSQCAQRIALITVRENGLCYGTNHYRGNVVRKARHLEKLGYKTVLVPYNYFDLMPEAEKIEKLRSIFQPQMQKEIIGEPKTEGIS